MEKQAMTMRFRCVVLALVGCGAMGVWGQGAAAPSSKLPERNRSAAQMAREQEAWMQAHNAARIENGARVTLMLSSKAVRDKNTSPDQTFDGNARTRCVVSHAPYTYRVELIGTLPITEINFIQDHYETAALPREMEVTLSDGTLLKKTLENLRPDKTNAMPRQRLAVGKDISWFEVKVATIVPGKRDDGTEIIFGGLGEIEAITTADLGAALAVPGLNKEMPAYIKGGTPRNDYSNVKVHMPVKIGLEGHPRIYMTREELVKWRDEIKKTERGAAAVSTAIGVAAGWLEKKIVFPDPKVPAQLKDRGDAAAKAHSVLSTGAGRCGWAYQLTDDEAYAGKAREILTGYARHYPNDYKEHKGVNPSDSSKVMAQRLSEAMWLLPLIQAYDCIHDAKCMTAADRRLIEEGLIRPALTLLNGKNPAADTVKQRDARNPNWRREDPATGGKAAGNWVNFYNAAYVQGGIVMGDQDWIDIGAADTKLMIARGIGDDGMWKEGAIGYQYFARMALIACMEPLARQGINVYGSNQCRVKNLFDTAYHYAYPDGTMPGINDTGRSRVGGDWMAGAYDYGWLRFRDPNYGAAVNGAPRQIFISEAVYFPTVIFEKLPEVPVQGVDSIIFDGLGYAIMRGVDGGNPTYLLMKGGNVTGGPHDHPDQLNLILFADGDELCGEPLFYRYEDDRHPGWTKTTVAHYSLAVDEHNQAKANGRLVGYYDAGAIKIMRGQSADAYPGVGLDRTVVQMPGYIVDVYRGWSSAAHTYDYPLCFRGDVDVLKGVAKESLKRMSLSPEGYSLFMTREPVTEKGNWSGTWARQAQAAVVSTNAAEAREAHPANEVKVMVPGSGETRVYAGVGPDERHKVVLRRQGREAVFACVIDPYREGDAVKSVESIKVEGPVPGYGLKVLRTDGGMDWIVVRFDPQMEGKPAAASTFAAGTTDALVAVVRLDARGKTLEAGMVGGTSLTGGGKPLSLPAAGILWEKAGNSPGSSTVPD